MIRVTNSIALRFDVIGKTLETLMDKQLMKTTVNNELSSKKICRKEKVFWDRKITYNPFENVFWGHSGGGEDMHLRFAASRYHYKQSCPLRLHTKERRKDKNTRYFHPDIYKLWRYLCKFVHEEKWSYKYTQFETWQTTRKLFSRW